MKTDKMKMSVPGSDLIFTFLPPPPTPRSLTGKALVKVNLRESPNFKEQS